MRTSSASLFVAALAAVVCLTSGASTATAAAGGGRYVADSYYIVSTSTTQARDLGCDQGVEDSLFGNDSAVILDFGAQNPKLRRTELPGGGGKFASDAQVEAASEAFAEGYFECVSDDEVSTRVIIGTNNSGGMVTSSGGKLWAEIVKTVADKVLESAEWTSHVSIWGGSDIETEYSNGGPVKSWAKAYSAGTDSPYMDYGAAEGCSQSTHKNSKCENIKKTTGWNQKVVYEVSWEIKGANPSPQIYHSPGDADEWTQIDLYKDGKMRFVGVLTDRQAEVEYAEKEREEGKEVQEPGNTPDEGYDQLHGDLEAQGLYAEIPFSLEINWQVESHADLATTLAIPDDASTDNESERPARIYAACMAPFAGYPPEKLEAIESECRTRETDSEKFTVAEEQAHKAELREAWPSRSVALEAAAAAAPLAHTSEVSANAEGPFGTDHVFAGTGHWIGEISGRWYEVYAGAKENPSTEQATGSELLVYTAPSWPESGRRPTLLGAFAPPGGETAPLTILGISGDVLEIQTSTGAVVRFNVADQSFLSS
jgi:hypothetical protein